MSAEPEEPVVSAPDDDAVAARLIDKLRGFIADLEEDERAVMAALLAPGVASAYTPTEEPEVVGFGMPETPWQPERLPDALSDRIREQHLRIEFD
jgi:hypothetical protein